MLGYEERALVSTDYTNDPRSAIVDGLLTIVVNGTQAKVCARYDDELGNSCHLVDAALLVGAAL